MHAKTTWAGTQKELGSGKSSVWSGKIWLEEKNLQTSHLLSPFPHCSWLEIFDRRYKPCVECFDKQVYL